jgi:GTP-binding protein HflX
VIEIEAESEIQDRAMLVAIIHQKQCEAQVADLLDELAELVATTGATVAVRHTVRNTKPKSRYLIGSGNAESIVQVCKENEVNLIVFDDDLNPSQQRNWEKLAKIRVIDRREVILDIFASRACTPEATLQIELARTQYLLPRLKRAWTHLSRQRGGAMLRGEGEKQIEVDARMVRDRIAHLKAELKVVRKRRAEQRKKRQQKPVPNAGIVGYTNAGKSSLLNCLTHAHVIAEDKLFATLDPTTRRIVLPSNQVLLLTDTVGFVRKLPHTLVEAFKSTLEEAVLADFLIHVVDVTSHHVDVHLETTHDVLEEIGAGDKYMITVFNKIDLIEDAHTLRRLRRDHPDAVFVSTKTEEGIPELVSRMEDVLDAALRYTDLLIPHDKYDLVALLHRTSRVISERYENEGIYVTAAVPADSWREVEPYAVA